MIKSYPCERDDLPKNFDGSPERPIRLNQDYGVWNLASLNGVNIYVEKHKEFPEQFWNEVYNRNIAIIFVEPRKRLFSVKKS